MSQIEDRLETGLGEIRNQLGTAIATGAAQKNPDLLKYLTEKLNELENSIKSSLEEVKKEMREFLDMQKKRINENGVAFFGIQEGDTRVLPETIAKFITSKFDVECNSWAKKDTERKLTFHRFPETNTRQVYIETEMGKHLMDQRKAWILKLKIGKQVSKSMKVCSLHFNKDDYFNKGLTTQRGRILKKTAVPSQKLPVSTVTSPKCAGTSSDRTDRYKRRESALCTSKNEDPQECDTETNVQAAENLVQLLKSTPDISEKDLDSAFVQNKKLRDAEVQVNIDRINTLSDLLKTNAALKSFTGINNFQILDCIVKMINEFCVTDVRSHRLNVRERVLLTMTKLKLDLSYVTLGALFSISGQLCKTYFFDFLTVLSQVLKVCIYFPSAEEVSKNLPKCFKNFKNCRAVLDCIEIFIQRPSCLCCRIKFYSQYK
nr:unnamed protein product [Callosobruchus analis]